MDETVFSHSYYYEQIFSFLGYYPLNISLIAYAKFRVRIHRLSRILALTYCIILIIKAELILAHLG
jgi:hypothetical protein